MLLLKKVLKQSSVLRTWMLEMENQTCPFVILQLFNCDITLCYNNDFPSFACSYKEMLNAVKDALNSFCPVTGIPM